MWSCTNNIPQQPLRAAQTSLVTKPVQLWALWALLTWVLGEEGLQAVLRPTEVLNEPRLAQRCQHGARAPPDVWVCQQAVRGFAIGLSKLVVVLREEALIAGKGTETQSVRVPTWSCARSRALLCQGISQCP